jgi:hypothetical protein
MQRSGGRLLDRLTRAKPATQKELQTSAHGAQNLGCKARKGLGYVDQIDYYPVGYRPEPGGLAPDVVIGLDLESIQESGLPTSGKLDASILVTAGQRLAKCRSGYCDGLSQPLVDFEFNGRLHHVSTTTGVSSSAARYKLAAEDIAKQIANALLKLFDDYREKDGPLPDLFVKDCGAEEVFSEAINPRGNGLTKTEAALRENGFDVEAEAISRVRRKVHWSPCVADLIKNLQRVMRKHMIARKLRFLLYPSGLLDEDRKKLEKDKSGVIWLGK